MEDPATTVPRSTPRQHLPITQVAPLTIQAAEAITPSLAGTTPHRRGTTSQPLGITTSHGFINRHRAITSRRHERTTGLIRIMGGTAAIAVGTMTIEGEGVTIITVDEAITMAVATTVDGVVIADSTL